MITSGNCLVDAHEADKAWHSSYEEKVTCEHCQDSGVIKNVDNWILAARESGWVEHWRYWQRRNAGFGPAWKAALAYCREIRDGWQGKKEVKHEADCPACMR